jgi:hypothetical protein
VTLGWIANPDLAGSIPARSFLRKNKMKIVINKCFGGFGLSPEAELWLFQKGFDGSDFKYPVDKFFKRSEDKEEALHNWKEYQKNKTEAFTLFVFTPDEKFVLSTNDIARDDKLLVECVETLGEKANGRLSELKVVEIPDGTDWEIDKYDGIETIEEVHNKWY